jgi:ketosteroid isomerase-like protein
MKALTSADSKALADLLGDDLVHIHANGHIEDKQQYLESISTKLQFIKVERASLNIRVYGDVAVATGILNQTVRVKASGATIDMRAVTTQNWICREDRWVQISFQATRLD